MVDELSRRDKAIRAAFRAWFGEKDPIRFADLAPEDRERWARVVDAIEEHKVDVEEVKRALADMFDGSIESAMKHRLLPILVDANKRGPENTARELVREMDMIRKDAHNLFARNVGHLLGAGEL